jgi:AcrR family transcriptional regulator
MDDPETQVKTHSQAAAGRRDDGNTQTTHKHTVRRSGEERRQEIAEVTLQLIASLGLQGATVSRIAQQVGMKAPSLYAHFGNRHEMLLAALDLLFERVRDSLRVSSDPDMLKRLREIGETHASFMTAEFEGFVIPLYEFITAPRQSGLSEAAGESQRRTIAALAGMVEEGQRQGAIRPNLDPQLAAWQLMVCFCAEDVARLMGIDEYLEQYSHPILDVMLRDMAPRLASAEAEHCPAASSAKGRESGTKTDTG